jgi:hypothetical protein
VLLNNNRWICLLPFARKPDPGRVSKQVSRELPQAWLFGLVRLAPQAERKAPQAEFSAPQASQFSAPQARKFTRSLRSPCSSRSVFARAALAEQHLRLLVVHKGGPPREGASFSCRIHVSVCGFFFLLPTRRQGCTGVSHADRRPPKQQGICSGARRWPFWGGAGRRPPCPNGALLEKNGRVARRKEAAGASRWGLGSGNRPSRQRALNTGRPAPGI